MDWTLFAAQLLNGLQLGMLLFLVAAGLTLIFGIMDFINLAHGSLYMVGAFFCATITAWTGSFVLAIPVALLGTALVAVVVEIAVARHLYARGHLDQVLATFGLILCFDTLVQMVWGPAGAAIPLPQFLDGSLEIFADFGFPVYRLVIMGVGSLVALALYLLIARTRTGMLIRAGASNRTMVSALGVDIRSLYTMVFALGSVLAGLAGLLIAPITEASIGMGNDIIIVAFVVIIIGGIGSVKGAFLGALLVGLIDTMGRSFLDDFLKLFISNQGAETAAPALAAMLVYMLMAAILAFRPQGLFPARS